MDTSIKIPQDDLILINELKNELQKNNIKTTQKNLIDKSIKFSLYRRKEFLSEIMKKEHKKDNTKEQVEKFLKGKRFDLEEKWLEEIDTTL